MSINKIGRVYNWDIFTYITNPLITIEASQLVRMYMILSFTVLIIFDSSNKNVGLVVICLKVKIKRDTFYTYIWSISDFENVYEAGNKIKLLLLHSLSTYVIKVPKMNSWFETRPSNWKFKLSDFESFLTGKQTIS